MATKKNTDQYDLIHIYSTVAKLILWVVEVSSVRRLYDRFYNQK